MPSNPEQATNQTSKRQIRMNIAIWGIQQMLKRCRQICMICNDMDAIRVVGYLFLNRLYYGELLYFQGKDVHTICTYIHTYVDYQN